MVSKENIIEFQEALKEEYNKNVDFQEASVMLNDLVSYFDLLAKINHKNKNMKKNNTIKVIKSGLVGATLGVAAGIMLAPESGKKFRGDIKKKSAEFYAYLAPKLKKIKKVGEEEYDSFVQNAIKSFEYGRAKSSSFFTLLDRWIIRPIKIKRDMQNI